MSEPRKSAPFQRAAVVVGVIAALFILGDLNRRMENARQLEQDAHALDLQVSGLQSDSQSLETQVAAATSQALVEAWAHGEGKLVREGEKLIVPISPPGAPTPAAPTPTPLPQPPSTWLIWRALLLGD
jgi:hypothetical protein